MTSGYLQYFTYNPDSELYLHCGYHSILAIYLQYCAYTYILMNLLLSSFLSLPSLFKVTGTPHTNLPGLYIAISGKYPQYHPIIIRCARKLTSHTRNPIRSLPNRVSFPISDNISSLDFPSFFNSSILSIIRGLIS